MMGYKIRRIKNEWEVCRTGKYWHIHRGKSLLRGIWKCLVFEIRHYVK